MLLLFVFRFCGLLQSRPGPIRIGYQASSLLAQQRLHAYPCAPAVSSVMSLEFYFLTDFYIWEHPVRYKLCDNLGLWIVVCFHHSCFCITITTNLFLSNFSTFLLLKMDFSNTIYCDYGKPSSQLHNSNSIIVHLHPESFPTSLPTQIHTFLCLLKRQTGSNRE